MVAKPCAEQVQQEGHEALEDALAQRDIGGFAAPALRPVLQVRTQLGQARLRLAIIGASPTLRFPTAMLVTRLLNACHHFPGFVYEQHDLCEDAKTIEIEVRPRHGSKARCSGCSRSAPGYDQLAERRFEFIPFWGFAVLLLYSMRRVDCRRCGVKVEEVPWGDGKHTLTKAYMLFLAHWARKLSWKETAQSLSHLLGKGLPRRRVRRAVGLEHRSARPDRAIGVDEIQYGRGHKYLTLVYQIEPAARACCGSAKSEPLESFQRFFTLIGNELAAKIEFVCSDMWKPYLDVIKQQCTEALQYPRSLPHRGQDEHGARRSPRRRIAPHGAARAMSRAEEIALVPAQAPREPHRRSASGCAICSATT